MGGGSSPRRADPPPSPAKVQDPAVQNAAAEALRKKQRGRGYKATIISKNMMSEDVARKLETLGT